MTSLVRFHPSPIISTLEADPAPFPQVQDGTISFSFDDLRWKFDSLSLLSLRSRLSGRGVDAYLDKLLRGYPEDVRSALQVRSLPPSPPLIIC